MAKLSPVFNDQTFDVNGSPAVGFQLFTYAAGSSTKLTTFSDEAGTVPNSNPIIINNDGYPTQGAIWLTEGRAYKFVLALPADTDPPTSPFKTIDNVTGIGDNTVSVSQWIGSGAVPTFITANSFSLVGDQTTEFHPGRQLRFTVASGTVYGYVLTSVFASLTTVVVRMNTSQLLDSNLSEVSLSILRADHPATPAVYNENRVTVASDATNSQIWGNTGNSIDFTGAAIVTNFPPAPQAGAKRWLHCAGATFTNGANIAVQGGVNYATASGDLALVEAITSTTFKITVFKANGTPIVAQAIAGAFKNLRCSATGLSALINVTADEVVVSDGSSYKTLSNVSVTPSLAASGANGLDVGASVASTWYSVWVIWNGTTTAGLLSLSATAPTVPSGYTHKARVGWVRSDGTANKYPLSFAQAGRRVQYQVAASGNITLPPLMASGVAGTVGTTLVSVSTVNFIPPTAAEIFGLLYATSGQTSVVSPNSVAPIPGNNGINNSTPSGVTVQMQFNFLVSGAAIFWASNGANSSLNCSGWVDNI